MDRLTTTTGLLTGIVDSATGEIS
ncbi:hypothetical protein STRTUCAR8_05992, partial [Streptomyces turgidiscabies Car8]